MAWDRVALIARGPNAMPAVNAPAFEDTIAPGEARKIRDDGTAWSVHQTARQWHSQPTEVELVIARYG